jgi:hypothetical protein
VSARNTLEAKRARRARRTLTKGRLPAYIDLVAWIQLRSNVTKAQARSIILAGCLRVDSHKLGYETINGVKFLRQHVPAHLNTKIEVHPLETEHDTS